MATEDKTIETDQAEKETLEVETQTEETPAEVEGVEPVEEAAGDPAEDTEQDESKSRAHRQAINYRRQLRDLEASSQAREEEDAAKIAALTSQLEEAQWKVLDRERGPYSAGLTIEQMQKLGHTIGEFIGPDGSLDSNAYSIAVDRELKAMGYKRGYVPSAGQGGEQAHTDKMSEFSRSVAGERFLKGY